MGRLKSTCITLLIMCLLCTCLIVIVAMGSIVPTQYIVRESGLQGGAITCFVLPIGVGICKSTFGEGWVTIAPTWALIRALNRTPSYMSIRSEPCPDMYSYTILSLIPPRWLQFSEGDAIKDERLEVVMALANEACQRVITPEDIRRLTAPFERR